MAKAKGPMQLQVQWRVLVNKFPQLPRATREAATHAVDASAERVRNGASDRTPPRVDTGAMMRGYRVERREGLERAVYNTQPYHVYQELGTSRIAPHPMLYPAAAVELPRLSADLDRVLGRAWR